MRKKENRPSQGISCSWEGENPWKDRREPGLYSREEGGGLSKRSTKRG